MTKKIKCKIDHEKSENNNNFGVQGMSLYVSNGVPKSWLDP
jgi:hypothetical protein